MSKTDKRQPAFQPGLLRRDARTSSTIRDKLGEQLRATYGRLEKEPLPDRLLALVRRLDERHSKGKS